MRSALRAGAAQARLCCSTSRAAVPGAAIKPQPPLLCPEALILTGSSRTPPNGIQQHHATECQQGKDRGALDARKSA